MEFLKKLDKMLNPFPKNQHPQQTTYTPGYIEYERSDEYYAEMERIESMWSVLSNLKAFNGDQAQQFEKVCLNNINLFMDMIQFNNAHGIENPKRCPAFVRLCMLYEKQQRYEEGIEYCATAIRAGAYNDNSNGKMYGRLARLIRKYNKPVDPSIHMLINKGEN